MKKILIIIAVAVVGVLGYFYLIRNSSKIEKGVSYTLAQQRKENIDNVEYRIDFYVPENKQDTVKGEITVSFDVIKRSDIVLDYVFGDNIKSVSLPYIFENEHIIINKTQVKKGRNEVTISFNAADQSLNRREDFLYTLLVPDRSRTLFPCFDQPNIKAKYQLSLSIPKDWKGISNSAVVANDVVTNENSMKILRFAQTEPLSTYLFSFVAGDLQKETRTKNNRSISLYHKESDPKKIAQCDHVIGQIFSSIEWLENYTGIKYPFSKYDLIVLPGFQYGGMEHTGATLYNDRKIFLNENPTLNEQLSRTQLIAHETAHMWFGDLVTMDWFSDVWTKEVFANYFASQIIKPLFPEINHDLSFMMSYFPGSYSEDRTEGTNPIQQQLVNLNQAGLVYGNIIYQKSPIVMNMLIDKVGEELFQRGIREYLTRYSYGNATWDDLITILDDLCDEDLRSWSNCWVHEKGMPEIEMSRMADSLKIQQLANIKGQNILFKIDDTTVNVYLSERDLTIPIKKGAKNIIPNCNGKSYGYFNWGEKDMINTVKTLNSVLDPILRGSILIMIHEAVIRGDIDASTFINEMSNYLDNEKNQLLYSLAISYVTECYLQFETVPNEHLESILWNIFQNDNDSSRRIIALRAYVGIMDSKNALSNINHLYLDEKQLENKKISMRDQISICYELSLHHPEKAEELLSIQRGRIKDPNLLKEFEFVSPAVSPSLSKRDSVFHSLLLAENREIEPWAGRSLSLLNHRLREVDSRKYIMEGLSEVQEVQQTGDIFFPKSWASSLLRNHLPQVVKDSVNLFFMDKPNYPKMLKNKILMNVIN